MSDARHRCGRVALAGRPNVGKSTLLNALVGQKLSIVTPRPQTTRHSILGVLTQPGFQMVLTDTPGLHRGAGRRLNQAMNRAAAASIADADLVALIADAARWTAEDDAVLERIREAGRPAVLVLNKVDLVRPKERLLPLIERLAALHDFAAIVPVSALKEGNLDELLRVLAGLLPEGPPLYPEDQVTDRSERFLAAEIVREKLTLALREELPYGIAVEIEAFEEGEDGQLGIGAVIWVEREGQKKIVIGEGGQRLKAIGRAARLELNEALGRRVHLTTWVKVRDNWADNEALLRQLGHELP